jgi:NAD(P)-dependent dehydrogenase (short-subunit alcohol dehydrogenase family)
MQQPEQRKRFTGNVVVITGAANGIGRAVAAAFVREGSTAYGVDIDAEGLRRMQREVSDSPGKFLPITADISKAADISRSVNTVLSQTARIDVLVNNAGINMGKRIDELEGRDWDQVFDTNLKSVYLMCKAVWPTFQSRMSGSIVNVASIMGKVGGIGAPAYCSTKAAMLMFSRCLAKDGARHRIRVNCVCPGYIDTPIMERVLKTSADPERARQELEARMPLGRLGTPEDVAAGILFLASADAAYISGAELTIDGAVTATQID